MAMAPMPPQGAAPAPAPESAPAPSRKSGGASELVASIHDGLMQLSEMMAGNQATQEEAQAMKQVMASFEGVVQSLGQAPGAKKPQPPMPGGPVPAEAGAKPVQPAL